MGEAKFTPEPWGVGVLQNKSGSDNIYIENAGGLIICEVGGYVISAEMAEANAHLISASPKLYKACEAVTDYFSADFYEDCSEVAILMNILRAALKKARGEHD